MIKKTISTIALTLLLGSGNLFAENLSVYKIATPAGSISNQSLSALNTLEQSGSDDIWSTYIEASPNSNNFIGVFYFNQPVEKQWQELKLKVNTVGEAKNSQHWQIQLRDFTNNRWVPVGDNSNASEWVWQQQTLSVTSNVSNYINTNNDIEVRYLSNNNNDISNIDQLTVELIEQSSGGPKDWWTPSPNENITWQWQLNGALDTSVDVDMYDVDLFETSAETIASLKASGKIVICYFSAGSYEKDREDWQQFFPFIGSEKYTGNNPPFAGNMTEWPSERWLDIRRIDLLAPIMQSRMELANEKGCDGVEPDNMDAYTPDNSNETGLSLTAQDQLDYNRWIAEQAHLVGLSVGLKNDLDQLSDLVDDFDWALNEQCFQYNECDGYSVFIQAGKAVFGVEYLAEDEGPSESHAADFCSGTPATSDTPRIIGANERNFYWLEKELSLGSWRVGCEIY